jgi:hypothetical protein
MPALRQIWFGFVGNIISALFVAICVALGFGPTERAEFLISGTPLLLTAGVARLAFLLTASAVIAFRWWPSVRKGTETQPIARRQMARAGFMVFACPLCSDLFI